MNHLSGMDATFLHMETPETPMHVGGLNLLELPKGYAGDFWEDAKAHIGRRLHLAPVFTRKLALMPFELANPVWVDDDEVDLDYHVRRGVLPRPGTRAQLEAYVGRLHSSLLDRSRPLWECYVIEGLQSGHLAFYTKAHHAAMDGASGAVLATAILDATPEPRVVKPPVARRVGKSGSLGVAELAGAALKNNALQLVKLVKLLPGAAKVAASFVLPQRREKDETGERAPRLPKGLGLGPKTMFNVAITNQRVFAGVSLPLAEVKAIAKSAGVTVNDVVLTLCSGALRRYLGEHDGVPSKSLRAAVPVSLREAGDTEMNNQATVMMVDLATTQADPLQRLRAIHDSTAGAKLFTGRLKAVIAMDFPSFGAPWLMTGLANLAGRSKWVNALPPVANLVISNVPGATSPLYLCGAKLLSNYPLSIPAHGMAMNMTVQSYNGSLDFGLTACRRAVPDIAELGEGLAGALKELAAAVHVQAVAVAAPEPVAQPAARRRRAPSAKALPRTPAKSALRAVR